MKRLILTHFFLLILAFSFYFIPGLVHAQDVIQDVAPKKSEPATTVPLENPLGTGNVDPRVLIGNVINAILGVVGSLALLMFIYGGVTWVISAGNEEKIAKGKNIILWASFGLAVIFFSYAMVRFVISALIKS